MTDLPCVASPNHPLGFSRGKAGYGRTVDFKTSRLIQAMICGIEQEITVTSPEPHAVAPDTVTLPAGRPLTLRQAARACRMKVNRPSSLYRFVLHLGNARTRPGGLPASFQRRSRVCRIATWRAITSRSQLVFFMTTRCGWRTLPASMSVSVISLHLSGL
jgi:hypothetical protein